MTATIDQAKFEALQGKVMTDVGGAMGLFMAYLGDQAGQERQVQPVKDMRNPVIGERPQARVGKDNLIAMGGRRIALQGRFNVVQQHLSNGG